MLSSNNFNKLQQGDFHENRSYFCYFSIGSQLISVPHAGQYENTAPSDWNFTVLTVVHSGHFIVSVISCSSAGLVLRR